MASDAAEDRQAARMSHAVAGNAAGTIGGDQSVGAEAHQVLADRRLWPLQFSGELGDLERASFQGFHDTEPFRVGKGAQGRGAVAEDFRVERSRLCHIQKFECIIHEVK